MLNKKHSPNYRWYILALTMATYGLLTGSARMCMPVLFKQISDDIGLNLVAIGTVWGMDPLAGIFIGLPSGLLVDRFGLKRTLFVICILAGVFGALRGFSVNFFTMALTMFLFGLTVAATPSILPKVTTLWFGGKQLGLANALLNVAWGAGTMVATMFSATIFSDWLGGWRNVLFMYGAPAILLGLLWFITGREPGPGEVPDITVRAVPFREALSHVVRVKKVWVIGIINMALWGASTGMIGYLALYLRNIGWSSTSADSAITVLSGVNTLGVVPMVLLAGKTSQKGVLVFSFAALALGMVLMPYVSTPGVWVLIVLGGFLRSATFPLLNVIIFETKDIGNVYGGTAVGLATTIAMLGAFGAPPTGNSLASISPGMPLVFWGVLAAAAIPLLLTVKTKPRSEMVIFPRVAGFR
jgi:NNP family nitrate/nitrite transporter-like MFS transporter